MEELGKSFDCYFPDKDFQQYQGWMEQPFSLDITIANVKDPKLSGRSYRTPAETHSTRLVVYGTMVLSSFWCHQMEGYPHIGKAALEIGCTVCHIIISINKDSQNWWRLKQKK